MKARIKATGEEIEVMQVYEKGDSFYVRLDMLSTTEVRYHISELEFEGIELPNQSEPDYWTRLEHQYAGQFMQAMISSSNYIDVSEEAMADASLRIAHALVEKLKEERK